MKNLIENWKKYVIKEGQEKQLEEVSFSAFNFPYDGNEEHSGAGSRTQYASSGDGFPTTDDTKLVTVDGKIQNLPKGTAVFFTNPWKLYLAQDIGLKGRGKYALVSLDSSSLEPVGYINIRKVEKPSGKSQSRVTHGAIAQDKIFDYIVDKSKEDGVEVEKISSAPPASTKPDLVVKYGDQEIQFEIKGTKSARGFITVFDKSLRRGVLPPNIVESVVDAYIEELDVTINKDLETGEALESPEKISLMSGLDSVGYPHTFEGVIDFYQNFVNSRFGFCQDRGDVPKSGKLPSDFITKEKRLTDQIRDNIVEHLKDSGDDYFVLYNSSNSEIKIYSVNDKFNPLGAPSFPEVSEAKLATYGGCSAGATRVGFKIRLNA